MQRKRGTEKSEAVITLDTDEKDRFFRAVIRRSLSGILIFQEDRVVFSNPALQEIVGLSEEKILQTSPFDLLHPADRDLVRQRAEQRLKGLSPADEYEFRIFHADGQSKWVRLLATLIDYKGKPAVLANLLDIEEHKRALESEREGHRLLATLLDSLPHPTMLVRRDGIILTANRPARDLGARIGGFCGTEFGCKVFRTDSSADPHPVDENPADGASGRCQFCQADRAFEKAEPVSVRGMEVDGSFWDVFWISADPDTYLHYAIDVTEQRQAEREIRTSEERYRLITDTMTDGLSVQNRSGVITRVNRRLCEITGFSRNELIGRPLVDLLVKSESLLEDFAAFRYKGTALKSETFIDHKTGHKVAVSLQIGFLADDEENHKGSFAFFSDISELKKLRPHAMTTDRFEQIVGREPSMRKLFAEIIEFAACDFPVLIQGESGVGKELVAQAVHNQGHRSEGLFVPVNCAALPEGLLESELFGHVRGAFTGAIRDKKGRFELAHGGTIFLDEIAELGPAMQAKLLRILQEGAFERVGDHRKVKVDVRVISATNKNLEREMSAGRFRRDLFYRLSVMPVHVPPLRDRRNDILLLAEHFIGVIAERASNLKATLSPEALALLLTHDWPGNVRELQNTVQYACVKSNGGVIRPVHLPPAIISPASKPAVRRKQQRKLNAKSVQEALDRTNGNKLQAAKLLSVNRSTLYRFLAENYEK